MAAESFLVEALSGLISELNRRAVEYALAGRLQDLADLEKIQARKDDLHVDWTYVAEWKKKLGLEKG